MDESHSVMEREQRGVLLILQLGSCNDADGVVDDEVIARCQLTKLLHDSAVDVGRKVHVLCSGGADPSFKFNPTSTPHWELVEKAMVGRGIPQDSILRPGLPALHTVDEAIMARSFVEEFSTCVHYLNPPP